MNSYLLSLYKQLSPEVKKGLLDKYLDSPISIRLIEFLSAHKTNDFNDITITTLLYGKEAVEKNFRACSNKYYKIRKRLIDDFKSRNIHSDSTENTEQFLYEIEYTSRHDGAWNKIQDRLSQLEAKLWKNNHFEHLDRLLKVWAYKNGIFSQFDNYKIIKRRRKVFELITDLHSMENYFFEIVELYVKYGNKVLNDYLEKLRYFSVKNKHYPRFALFYNYISFRYKLDLVSSVNKQQLNKHLNYLKRMYNANPEIPFHFFQKNNRLDNKILLLDAEIRYCWNNWDLEKQEILLQEKMELLSREEDIGVAQFRSNGYVKMMNNKMSLHKYTEAWKVSDEFHAYLKKYRPAQMHMAYLKKAEIICYAYPIQIVKDYDNIINYLTDWLRKSANQKSQTVYQVILFLLSRLYLIRNEYSQAMRLIKRDEVKNLLNHYLDYQLFLRVFDSIARKDYTHYDSLLAKVVDKAVKEKVPHITEDYEWLRRVYRNMRENATERNAI